MQKRANIPARTNGLARATARTLVRLTLALIAAGGLTAVSMTQCHGVAQAQVEATFVRHGPFGTAAGFSAPSDGFGSPTGPARRDYRPREEDPQL